jgi:hypothetical protein
MTTNGRLLAISICAAGLGILNAEDGFAQTSQEISSQTCAPWIDSGGGHDNAESVNLGCTNRNNLRGMVEDKHDLDHGRTLGPADAERESQAVKRYEEGSVKEATPASSSPGALLIPTASPQGSPQ